MRPDRPVPARALQLLKLGVLLSSLGSVSSIVIAATIDETVDETVGWQPASRTERLSDGSVLTEYTAGTSAFDSVPARLELSFSPRFDCDPMIGFVLDDSLEPSRDEDGTLQVRIDGVRLAWPGPGGVGGDGESPDAVAPVRSGWLFADRQRRRTVRLRIDVGDLIALGRTDGAAIVFSLLGSRDGNAAAERACRAHEPLPYDGP